MITATSPQSPAPRKGDWMQTRSGKMFYALDPQPGDILIEDIAHALSMLCRFGGHCNEFYSVAQHSVHVSELLPHHLKLSGLLHDATEAYLGDMVRPLKELMPAYKKIEEKLEVVILDSFDVLWALDLYWDEIKRVDNILLVTEARDVRHWSSLWTATDGISPLKKTIVPWGPRKAKAEFLKEYHKLTAV